MKAVMGLPREPRAWVHDVIRVEEPDYRYGAGPLILRITAIGEARREADGLWLELRRHEAGWNGEADPSERHALVRLEAVRLVPSPGES